ncbi:MAG: dihydrolipoyl dehydrogenase [Deltaproteobacteria bacterium]|jgi:dihydrolipoamide dehydrogenase|nr:dihydrolipoyl dehydrogenase [Deltaproteobacteria bacterium]MBW2536207.1 dihydrolipoyl dehydrogenase [Deltaproteobacteria bacterium]
MDSYDLVIIGSGPGGYVCAIRAAQLGLKTALVEQYPKLGGTCLNVGCIPSKALLESSELYAAANHRFADHGIGVGAVQLDLARMMARKSQIVGELTDGVAMLMKKNKVTVLTGRGQVAAPGKVTVTGEPDDQEVAATNICLAMGSVPVELPFAPFDGERIVSSTEALSFGEVPKRLVVIGAGAVGLEMASVWSRLGAKVTVVEMLPTVAPFADRQMSSSLQRALEAQGLEFRLSTKLTAVDVAKKTVKVTVASDKGESEELRCDRVLVAVGRRPNSKGAGLEEIGVELEQGGRVKIDDHFATNVKGIYAIGDLVRGPMLAHKAEDEGLALAEILAGKPGHVNYDAIPNVVYTEPELAMVGRTEAELKEAGIAYSTGRFMFRPNGRAKSLGQLDGMVKILADKETDEVLGVHMVGPRVSELIAEAVVAMEFRASAEDLALTCHAHPTLSEVVREAALAVGKRAIHS